MAKQTTAQKLAASGKDFTHMTYTEILDYGRIHFNSASGFSSFKRQLLAYGVDFEAKKQEFNDLKDACKPPVTHTLDLYTDYASKFDRFAVTSKSGFGYWYGKSFDALEQSEGEKDAVCKAIYLAGLARVSLSLPAHSLLLTIYTDAEWLTYWNNGNNKATSLAYEAKKAGIELDVVHIAGKDNPADELTRSKGFCKSRDNLLIVSRAVKPVGYVPPVAGPAPGDMSCPDCGYDDTTTWDGFNINCNNCQD
jgi:hypothetical protein